MCLREKIGPDPRNFNQRVSLGRNDLLIRTFPKPLTQFQSMVNRVGLGDFNLAHEGFRLKSSTKQQTRSSTWVASWIGLPPN
jgi:hypothetical protein